MTTQNLSQDGQRRRDEMLPMLQRAVGARRQRRVAVRGAGVALLLGIVSAGAWLATRPGAAPAPVLVDGPDPMPAVETVASATSPLPEVQGDLHRDASNEALGEASSPARERSIIPRVRLAGGPTIRRVVGDPDAVVRVRGQSTPEVPIASDEALAHGLRAAGINAGVARAGSRVLIVLDDPPPAG